MLSCFQFVLQAMLGVNVMDECDSTKSTTSEFQGGSPITASSLLHQGTGRASTGASHRHADQPFFTGPNPLHHYASLPEINNDNLGSLMLPTAGFDAAASDMYSLDALTSHISEAAGFSGRANSLPTPLQQAGHSQAVSQLLHRHSMHLGPSTSSSSFIHQVLLLYPISSTF